MGWITYTDSSEPIEIDDRSLAHLKTVVTTKLRRNESFTVSWPHAAHVPGGRSTIWVSPAIPLRFTFESTEPEDLSADWLTRIAETAAMRGDIRLVPEDEAGPLTLPARAADA